jgi:ATP synthase subunit 6
MMLIIALRRFLTNSKIIKRKPEYMKITAVEQVKLLLNIAFMETVKGIKFILLTLFVIILMSNIIGLIPMLFTLTCLISVTMTLSISIIVGYLITLFLINKYKGFAHMLPENTPFLLMPIFIFTETISYIIKIISLSVRLSGNLTSGHLILLILTMIFFIIFGSILGFLNLMIIVLITMLEFFICFIQAFVFSLLYTLYTSENE